MKILLAVLLFSLPVLAQNAVHEADVLAALQQGGVFLQLQNSGATLAVRTAGLVTMNCTGNLACSYDSPSGTFTMNNDPNVTVLNFPSTQAVSGSVSISAPVTIGNSLLHPVPVTVSTPVIVMAYVNGVPTPVQLVEGQSVMAQSIPVTLASDQTPVPSTQFGIGPDGKQHQQAVDGAGNTYIVPVGLPRPPCNPVRRINCQP